MEGNLKIKLFESIKKFNKNITTNYKDYRQMNLNDIIVCKLIYQNEQKSKLTQVKDISEHMGISRPAVNTILNRLEDRGLIERIRLKDNRKSVYVNLTIEAHKLYELEKEKLSKLMEKVISIVGEDESNKLIELLDKVNNILEEEVI